MSMLPLQTIPDSERPKRADAVANRAVLLNTAKQLFDEAGVANVNMSQIAREAGVGKGTLYRAFANKGALCFALMDEDLRHFQEAVFLKLTELHEAAALDRLVCFLDSTIRFFDRHVLLMAEAQAHGLQISARPEVNQTMIHGWFHQTVSLLIQQAQGNGEVSAETDPAYLADIILAPLNPTLFQHQRSEIGLSLDDISRDLIKFVLHGVSA